MREEYRKAEVPKFADKEKECIQCGRSFTVTQGELFYLWSKNLAEFRRCAECRLKRRVSINWHPPEDVGGGL